MMSPEAFRIMVEGFSGCVLPVWVKADLRSGQILACAQNNKILCGADRTYGTKIPRGGDG
jgi:hypothetical protein